MKDKLSFEQAIKQLEEIVQKLENGGLNLDESIKMFEKGIKLSKLCSKQLDDAERRITMLIQTSDGNFEEIPFLKEEEN